MEERAGTEFGADELAARWGHSLSPAAVAGRLAGVRTPWCVAAGWAIELFTGRSRPHGDIEIAVPGAGHAEVIARFEDCELDAPIDGRVWRCATPEEFASTHQTWVRDPVTDHYLVDVFREPHDGDTWICRRDDRIRRPYTEVVHRTAGGVPFLVAEVVLLFKAKAAREKDEIDFAAALPLLGAEQRATLAGWLRLVHPGHPWISRLDSDGVTRGCHR
ncbi:hypothetical protein [Pseudonocardia sp. HH130630-07]|uniref:hypothetical protein n=1 Tax=Pseudonocardia sp. HH130630-07 TaxID=1690815 RepID=UPI000814C193|nr:hypothetical protein [Pseudonocardia sp. HH130630-07]ANY05158.1 hypothetical protein AFB00_01180 [Pseudonocardia sp. HH130630-07]